MSEIAEFEDWTKIDLRVAQVIKVEDIPNADKLYKLTLDAGPEIGEKIICSGLKEHYSKEELENKKIIYFSNLKPRKMRGIESEGMLLAASTKSSEQVQASSSKGVRNNEKVILISPESDIENGSKIS